MNTIPVFYYDVLARIIPGGMLLALFRVIGLRTPEPWPVLLSRQETWNAVVIPLIFLAVSYILGALLDGFFRAFGCAKRFGRRQYEKVLSEDKGWRLIPAVATKKNFEHDAWQWLALKVGPENAAAFSLAHRFQAESRLFMLSAGPAAWLTGRSVSEWLEIQWAGWAAAACILCLFLLFGFKFEKDRWIWTLAAVTQLNESWPQRWTSSPQDGKS